LMIMDLGGGSAQFILGEHGHKQFCRSFPLGCVRLLEQLRHPENPAPADLKQCRDTIQFFLSRQVQPILEPLLDTVDSRPLLVGTGGTATILARMQQGMNDFDRDRIESARFGVADVTAWVERLWSMPLAARKELPGLPPNRADVVLMGTAVYEAVMTIFHLPELRISTRGLRFGAVLG
jgi:exopolyphosphatase / guanosine-5'-triphosphate,3'-diphosphate pyrophosphatase